MPWTSSGCWRRARGRSRARGKRPSRPPRPSGRAHPRCAASRRADRLLDRRALGAGAREHGVRGRHGAPRPGDGRGRRQYPLVTVGPRWTSTDLGRRRLERQARRRIDAFRTRCEGDPLPGDGLGEAARGGGLATEFEPTRVLPASRVTPHRRELLDDEEAESGAFFSPHRSWTRDEPRAPVRHSNTEVSVHRGHDQGDVLPRGRVTDRVGHDFSYGELQVVALVARIMPSATSEAKCRASATAGSFGSRWWTVVPFRTGPWPHREGTARIRGSRQQAIAGAAVFGIAAP